MNAKERAQVLKNIQEGGPPSPMLLRTMAQMAKVEIHIELRGDEAVVEWVKIKNGIWTAPLSADEAFAMLDEMTK